MLTFTYSIGPDFRIRFSAKPDEQIRSCLEVSRLPLVAGQWPLVAQTRRRRGRLSGHARTQDRTEEAGRRMLALPIARGLLPAARAGDAGLLRPLL